MHSGDDDDDNGEKSQSSMRFCRVRCNVVYRSVVSLRSSLQLLCVVSASLVVP